VYRPIIAFSEKRKVSTGGGQKKNVFFLGKNKEVVLGEGCVRCCGERPEGGYRPRRKKSMRSKGENSLNNIEGAHLENLKKWLNTYEK